MAFEDLKASIALLLDEISRRPKDRHVLQQELREKIAQMEALGLPVPEDYLRFEAQLARDDADDLFDNMPV